MSAHLYIEGAESKQDKILCRQAFSKLLAKAGFEGRMPRLTACGARNSAFDDFRTAHAKAGSNYVALLVDSEDPIDDIDQTWPHLRHRDGWATPPGAPNDQVLLMTTCMETWIAADRQALHHHYGTKLQPNALPPTHNLESRHRHHVQDALAHATRNCSNAYCKGRRSFRVLETLSPSALEPVLPSFARALRILRDRLL